MKGLKATIKWIIAIVVICVVLVFLASINGLNVSRTVMTVGGNDITEAEYKYYFELAKNEIASEQGIATEDELKEFLKNGKIDGKAALDVIKEKTEADILRTEIARIKAEEEGISISDEQKSAARAVISATDADTKAQLKEIKKTTGADKYLIADIMEKAYLTDTYYSFVTSTKQDQFTPDEVFVDEEMTNSYACVKHVLIKNTPDADENGVVPEVEGYAEEAKKKAEEVLAKAVAGENFEDLIKEYGEDPGMEATPDGYIIDSTGASIDGSGVMVSEFTEGTFAVLPGEVNAELVESSYGWHIIKRYGISPNNENYATVEAAAKNKIVSEMFDAYLDSFKDSIEVTKNDKIIAKIK